MKRSFYIWCLFLASFCVGSTLNAQEEKNAFDLWLEAFNTGLQIYNNGDYTNAITHFTNATTYIDYIDFSTDEITQLYPIENYTYLGICYQNINNSVKAIEYFELTLRKLRALNLNEEDYETGLLTNLSFAYETIDIQKSLDYKKEVVERLEKTGIEDQIYAINLYDLAFLYMMLDNMPSFYTNLIKAEKIFSKLNLTSSDHYAITSFYLGNYYFEINDFRLSSQFLSKTVSLHDYIKEFEPYIKEEVVFLDAVALYNIDAYNESLQKINSIIDHPELKKKENIAFYSNIIDRKGMLLIKFQRYEETKSLYQNFESYIQNNHTTNSEIFAQHYTNYGRVLVEIDDFINAEIYLNKAEKLYADLNLTQTENYTLLLNSIGLLYFSLGDYEKSEAYYNKALELVDTIDSLYTELNKINILNNLALTYQTVGEFDKALPMYQNILERKKVILGEDNLDYAVSLMNYGNLLGELGNYEEAESLYLKALDVFKNTVGETDINYAKQLLNLGQFYLTANRYKISLDTFNEVLDIYEKNNQSESYVVGLALTGKGLTLQNLGELEKALLTQIKAQEIFRNTMGESHKEYGKISQNLGMTYFTNGQVEKAVEQYQIAYSAYQNSIKQGHYLYGVLLLNIADALVILENIPEAIKNYDIAAENFKFNYGENSYFYATTLMTKGIALIRQGNYEEAINILTQIESNLLATIDYKSNLHNQFYFNLAVAYDLNGQYNEASINYSKSNTSFFGLLEDVFTYRSEDEKKQFLKRYNITLSWLSNSVFNPNHQIKSLIETGLNNQLMLKGLLLNTTKDILSELSNTSDKGIREKIEAYRIVRKEQENLLNSQTEKTPALLENLKSEINNLETDLVRLYNESPQFKSQFILKDWKQIKTQLKTNEIALEFSVYNKRTNSIIGSQHVYGVYLIHKDWEEPKVINLFDEAQLKAILQNKSPNTLYKTRGSKAKSTATTKGLYELIWAPIEPYLAGIETVYFSPIGLLNQIPFAALDTEGKSILANQYNLVQLSSCYVLTEKSNEPNAEKTLFIGGVDYNYNPTGTATKTIDTPSELEILRTISGTRSMDSKWNYLPGTLEEINTIERLYQQNNRSYSQLIGKEASEGALKDLSGQSPDIIHIATHGFFFEIPKISSNPTAGPSSKNIYKNSEDPLLRSGLVLYGANYAWINGNNPYEDENGILTALEISNLDLSNTELVVLSACETGLGDIEGSEGVYGLQRAFKMAGVNLIMMSLWEVPDKETSEFMTQFYTNWLNGQDIRTAFRNTQIEMSKTYNNSPEKWAAFVLFE